MINIKKIERKDKNLYCYIIVLIISIFTIFIGLFQTNFTKTNNYEDFSDNWYFNNEEIYLEDIYKYDEIKKILPNVENDTQIYMNVKSINVDVYIEDECIYKYEDYNKNLFGKTPGSYFIRLNIKKEYSGKQIILKLDNAYNDTSGKITEIYIGDSVNIILNFVSNHLFGILVSTLIIFIGICSILIYLISKSYQWKNDGILYLGLFALVIGTFMFTDSKFLQIINGDEYLYHMISEICMLLIVVPLMSFIEIAYKNSCNHFIINILCKLGIFNFLCCFLLNLFNILDYHESLIITHSTYILCVIYIIFICFKSIISKNRKEIYHTLGLLGICLGCVIDIIILYTTSSVETTLFTRMGVLLFLCLEGAQFWLEFLNIFRQKERISLLQKIAYEDGLTGLLNRTSFNNDINDLQNCTKGLIAVFDVNDLKLVNDNHGHDEGDNLIITVADNLKKFLSPIGKCYRIGGDEFVFISDRKRNENDFICSYKNLIKNLNIYNKTSGKKYDVKIAMGYSIISEKNNIENAFKIADSNMYENKRKMKNIID